MGLFDFWRKSQSKQKGKLIRSEYLDSYGWYMSMARGSYPKKSRIHFHAQPVLPYPITGLLDLTDWKSSRVFVRLEQYTYRWFLRRAKRVSSSNVEMHRIGSTHYGRFESNPDVSISSLSGYMADHPELFDLMALDGPNKQEALPVILRGLTERGVVVMSDDMQNEYDYQEAVSLLQKAGFRTLHLCGPAPRFQILHGVIAYRPGNILGL